jgi:hypothetical protein
MVKKAAKNLSIRVASQLKLIPKATTDIYTQDMAFISK